MAINDKAFNKVREQLVAPHNTAVTVRQDTQQVDYNDTAQYKAEEATIYKSQLKQEKDIKYINKYICC